MAFDLTKLNATKATVPARQGSRAKRDLGPNPWLDANWPFNLQASYDQKTAFDIPFSGAVEMKPATRGKPKENGESVEKVTGDAFDAITMLRDAADKLDLGVSIRTYTGKTPEGKVVPKGQVMVRYAGQKRKAVRKVVAPTAAPTQSAPAGPATATQQSLAK